MSVPAPPLKTTTSSYSNVLLISLLGIFLTSFAIILYHFVLIRYCMRRHTNAATPAAAPPSTGVDENILETMPIFTFSKVIQDMEDEEECVVCLGELEQEDLVRQLPNCKHAFHVTCIDQWFSTHSTCPLCRSPLVPNLTDPEPSTHIVANSTSDPDCESSTNNLPATEQPQPLLRHCSSLVLPPSRLKRSLSMDSSLIVMNLQRTSSGGAFRRIGSYSSRPSNNSGGVSLSSKWLRSLSRLSVGKGTANGTILPY